MQTNNEQTRSGQKSGKSRSTEIKGEENHWQNREEWEERAGINKVPVARNKVSASIWEQNLIWF